MDRDKRETGHSRRLRNLLGYALAGWGALAMVGYVTGEHRLMKLARAYNASPLPMVFGRKPDGSEQVTQRFEIAFETELGSVVIPSSPGFSQRLAGSFRRKKPWVLRLLWPENKRAALAYGLCNGPLARELGVEGRVRSASVRRFPSLPGTGRSFEVRLACEP